MDTVEEVVESTTTDTVEEVVESTTTNEFGLSDDDVIGVETASEEPEETETLLTEGEDEPVSNTQKRFNEITAQKKMSESKLAQQENLNNYLLNQIEKYKAAKPEIAAVEVKEPTYAEFLEKFDQDDDKAREGYIAAKVEYAVRNTMSKMQTETAKKQELDSMLQAEAEYFNKSFTPEVTNQYPDFLKTVSSATVQFTDPVKSLIYTSPVGHAIAYHLATNSNLRDQLNNMSPAQAGKQIGILEQQLATPVNKKLKSKAAEAITPIGSKAKAKKVKEEDLPMEEFMALEQKKIVAAQGF